MVLRFQIVAVIRALALVVLHFTVSLALDPREDPWCEAQRKLPEASFQLNEEAKRRETDGGTGLQECYGDGLGCFKVGNYLTHGGGLPRSPHQVQTVTTIFTNLGKSTPRVLSYTDRYSFYNLGGLDVTKGLKVVFHGFKQDGSNMWIKEITAIFVKAGYTVIVVDWESGQNLLKPSESAKDTAMVGRQASVVVRLLMHSYPGWIHSYQIHAIGFSMGAHAAGFFGRHFEAMTGQKIGRITGLDPASVYFEGKIGHLTKHDALFVDVIHTSAGHSIARLKFGFAKPLGHVDFYPNGGSWQPGCRWSPVHPCSHRRATRLFVASLKYPRCRFTSWPCPRGYQQALAQACPPRSDPWITGRMGYFSVTAPGRGVQYLRTYSSEPYCEN